MKQWYNNLKIAYKLALGFGTMLVCMVTLSAIALQRAQVIAQTTHLLVRDLIPINNAAHDLLPSVESEEAGLRAFSDGGREASLAAYTRGQEQFTQDLASLRAHCRTYPDLQRLTEEIDSQAQSLNSTFARIIGLVRAGKTTAARSQLAAVTPQLDAVRRTTASLDDQLNRLLREADTAGSAAYAQSVQSVVGFTLLTCLLGIVLSRRLARSMTRTLTAFTQRMENLRDVCLCNLRRAVTAMADGDLTVVIESTTKPLYAKTQDEFGCMARVFNGMIEQTQAAITSFGYTQEALRGLIGQVSQSAEATAETGRQLSASADQAGQAAHTIAHTIQEVAQAAGRSATTSREMAEGSERQASSASDAAGAMEKLQAAVFQVRQAGERQQAAAQEADEGMRQTAQSIEEVARSAQQMAATARQAETVAEAGGKAIQETVLSMSRLREQVEISADKVAELGAKGEEIGAIVETIDRIAEQTNLLALNAAIEAARAGEHGKGFAVVADEVRKLAERAAAATKEIAGLIESVRSGVEDAVEAMQSGKQEVSTGAAWSEEAGSALMQILSAAHATADEVSGLTSAAQETAASVQTVSASVTTVHQAAAENERSVGEMSVEAGRVSAAIAGVAADSRAAAAGAEEMSASAGAVADGARNVSAAVEEQTTGIEQISAAAGELNAMEEQLRKLVGRFRLEADPPVRNPLLPEAQPSRRKAA